MVSIPDTGRQISTMGNGPQAGYVEIRLFHIAAHLSEDGLDEAFRFGVMNELRLERRQYSDELFDWEVMLQILRIRGAERLLNHSSGQMAQCHGAGPRREYEDIAIV